MKPKKRSLSDLGGIMYSTDPSYSFENEDKSEPAGLTNQQQDLRVRLDRKNRGGKEVTVITGFVGHEEELKELTKMLKTKCGVGGSSKDGEVLIQGNVRDKVIGILQSEGFKVKKSGG